jgi:hypothetical protein
MEDRVDKERNRLLRIGDALVIVKDPKLRQGKGTTAKKRMNPTQAAIRLQAMIRGAIVRSRLRRSKRAMQKVFSVITIQNLVRRFLARVKTQKLKNLYRRDMLHLRKSILRKNKAASIVQHFFRYVVFLASRARYMKKYDLEILRVRDFPRLIQINTAIVKIQKVYRGHICRKDLARYFRKLQRNKDHTMTRRENTFSLAGSGGFKFRRKTDANFADTGRSKNRSPGKPVMRTDPMLLRLIQQESEFFQTLLTSDAEHMKIEDDLSKDSSADTDTLLRRRGTLNLTRKAYTRINSFGPAVVSGKNVMRTAAGESRHFIIDKLKKASESRRTNKAYINPNVHKRPVFVRSGSLQSLASSQSEGANEVRNLLSNVFS